MYHDGFAQNPVVKPLLRQAAGTLPASTESAPEMK